MKTQAVLTTPESELSGLLKEMKIKELEKHARKVLSTLGQQNYDAVLASLIRLFPTLPESGDRFAIVQHAISEQLPPSEASNEDVPDILQRLTVIFTVLITKKFHKIHAS